MIQLGRMIDVAIQQEKHAEAFNLVDHTEPTDEDFGLLRYTRQPVNEPPK